MKASPSRQTANVQPSYPPSPFRLFEDFFNDWAIRSSTRNETWKPPVDIIEKDGNLILRVEVPGVDEKGIDVKVEGRVLTIKGERKPESETNGVTYHQVESYYGTFTRSFTLPDSADSDQINASYKNGVLAVAIAQKAEAKSRSISIGTA
jgi:HSP20 family protein